MLYVSLYYSTSCPMDLLKGLIEVVLLMKVSGFGMHVLNNTHLTKLTNYMELNTN
jgi:hypothetical protein